MPKNQKTPTKHGQFAKFLSLLTTFGIGINLIATKLEIFALEKITNPAIGELGDDADKAKSGQLLLEQFVRYWGNAITVGGLITIVYFLWGAFEWIMSDGDSGKLQKARNKMMHAAIGLLILVSAFIILGFISTALFGDEFNLLKLNWIFPENKSGSQQPTGPTLPVQPGQPQPT